MRTLMIAAASLVLAAAPASAARPLPRVEVAQKLHKMTRVTVAAERDYAVLSTKCLRRGTESEQYFCDQTWSRQHGEGSEPGMVDFYARFLVVRVAYRNDPENWAGIDQSGWFRLVRDLRVGAKRDRTLLYSLVSVTD